MFAFRDWPDQGDFDLEQLPKRRERRRAVGVR
ncbi:hypothetical protein LINGRAHAP2_LOCUS4396 [Linum grandiflorum]